jgi:hypothetical protein
MKQRKSFLLRMDPALYAALEAWAQQELRSLNGQIEYLLKEAIARQRRGPAGDNPEGPMTDSRGSNDFSEKTPPHG